MVSLGPEERKAANPRYGREVLTPAYVEECREARMGAEQQWPELEFIDPIKHLGGEFVGFYLGVPYDWSVLDPDLMEDHET